MNHYLMAGRLISAKLVSWEELERLGKALPTRRIAPYQSDKAKWFLNKNTQIVIERKNDRTGKRTVGAKH